MVLLSSRDCCKEEDKGYLIGWSIELKNELKGPLIYIYWALLYIAFECIGKRRPLLMNSL